MRKFNLYFAIAAVLLDAILIYSAMFLAYKWRAGGDVLFLWPPGKFSTFTLTFLPVWLILLAYQGLYSVRTPAKGWSMIGRTATAILSGWGVILIYLYLSRSPEALVFPRLIIAYGVVATLLLVFAGRFLLDATRRLLNRAGYGLVRTVVIAKNEDDPFITSLAIPVHARKIQAVVTNNFLQRLGEISKAKKIDEIVVAWPDLDEKTVLSLLNWAESNFVNFAQVPTLLSVKATNIESGSLGNSPIIYYKASPLDGWGRVFKRLLDLIIVVPALIILSPVFLLLTILVRLSSPGPVLYSHHRVGQDGQVFTVRKFRSMYENAEHKLNITWSMDDDRDPRITPIGRILRKTNLDEIPQLWDVLLGKMSLVGPRPEQPKYVEKFSQEIPDYIKRHHVKAGLTGWAQINGLRGDTSISERVKYDLYYIEHWSIWFDLRIILSTFIYMFRRVLS